jgi:hypothetical protein
MHNSKLHKKFENKINKYYSKENINQIAREKQRATIVSILQSQHKFRPSKRPRQYYELIPILFVDLFDPKTNTKQIIKALLDTGATSTLINSKVVDSTLIKENEYQVFKTAAGLLTTQQTVEIQFSMPELYEN